MIQQSNIKNTTSNQNIDRNSLLWQTHSIIPNWLVNKSVICFFIALFACWLAYGYVPPLDLVCVASISILLFFYVGNSMSRNWYRLSEKGFLKNLFIAGILIRFIWVLYMFFLFNPKYYGNTYGSTADVDWYMDFGRGLAEWIRGNTLDSLPDVVNRYMSAIDDIGYPMMLAIEYVLTGGVSDVFIPLLLKCVMSTYCAISIYRIASRHFGVSTARMAAIFVCLNPNIIYWCSNMMKETEMVFVCCLAIDKLDEALSSGTKLTLKSLSSGLLIGLILFFMRTPLALALFLAVGAHIVMASKRVIGTRKKTLATLLVVLTLFVGVGDRFINLSKGYLERDLIEEQKANMEWRANREAGQKGMTQDFARYAGAAVFAPLIFTIPFPTFNTADAAQLVQVQTAGGSFIKNILSFFVVMVLLRLLFSGEWRKHVFIIAYTCAYLVVLVFSGFAQSGRYHMPIWPMLMLFAAFGLQMAKFDIRWKKWFSYVVVAEIAICLMWNWYKLAGRGLI